MDQKRISLAIEVALEAEGYESPKIRHDIAFHMTDWIEDLQAWHRFCESPESLGPAEVIELMTRFLVHVPNHAAAASMLLTGIPVSDVFNVGATAATAGN